MISSHFSSRLKHSASVRGWVVFVAALANDTSAVFEEWVRVEESVVRANENRLFGAFPS